LAFGSGSGVATAFVWVIAKIYDSSNVELSHTIAGTLRQNEGIQDGKNTNAESKQTFDKSIPNTTQGTGINPHNANAEASKAKRGRFSKK
jgi:hypothetical protein